MKKGEIWLIELPFFDGKEQEGIRPGIILADTKTNMVIIIPLTSHEATLRFPNTFKIKKSLENNLDSDSVALIFQLKSIDKKRLVYRLGNLSKDDLTQVDLLTKQLLRY